MISGGYEPKNDIWYVAGVFAGPFRNTAIVSFYWKFDQIFQSNFLIKKLKTTNFLKFSIFPNDYYRRRPGEPKELKTNGNPKNWKKYWKFNKNLPIPWDRDWCKNLTKSYKTSWKPEQILQFPIFWCNTALD